jgi:type III restriction enzyme
MRFIAITQQKIGFSFPKEISYPSDDALRDRHGSHVQASLFDFVPTNEVNDLERDVVWYLEDQEQLLFWYRNMARRDYFLQGWRPARVYPDFIFSAHEKKGDVDVYVIETKGEHLIGSEDTKYKRKLFELCNREAKKMTLASFGKDIHNPVFEMLPESKWEVRLNQLLTA